MKPITIEKALYRLGGKLSNRDDNGKLKPFYTDKFDLECFNRIVDFVEDKQKKQLINNQLFGKLYIYLYGEFVNYYNSNIMSDIPQKELHRLLCKDLRSIVQEVTDRINLNELDIDVKYSQKNKTELKHNPLTYEEVANNMRLFVNGALNEYNK